MDRTASLAPSHCKKKKKKSEKLHIIVRKTGEKEAAMKKEKEMSRKMTRRM